MSKRYTVFTSGQCPWCVKAINVMANLGLDMDVVSLKNNSEAIKFLQDKNLRTVPQIFVGDDHIGGYEDFLKYAAKKGLKPKE